MKYNFRSLHQLKMHTPLHSFMALSIDWSGRSGMSKIIIDFRLTAAVWFGLLGMMSCHSAHTSRAHAIFFKKRERYAHAHPFAWYGWWGLVRSARRVKRCALTPLWHYSEIWICLPPLCRLPNSCCLRPESPSYHTPTHGEPASIPAARFRHELWLADEHSCWFQICWLLILPSATRPQLSFLCLFG